MNPSLPLQSQMASDATDVTFCYSCTEHETTGFAPFFLMFGRIPCLPVDVLFQHALPSSNVVDHCDFVSCLKHDLSETARISQQNSRTEQDRQAENYNCKIKGSPLTVGNRVLLANCVEKGKRKIADKWDSTVYEVVSVKPGINVYCIRDPVTSREKVVHRNLLLPVSFLPLVGHRLESSCSSVAGSEQGDPVVPDVVPVAFPYLPPTVPRFTSPALCRGSSKCSCP